ncbi:hypothetical protein [Lactobacillus terrae]|uniref:hypothetical protein n=1 Tax=Lactobacillus terrae TaxID=2269374 RepID=UPI000C1B6F79|nr:hypothetical protein [Lactobacillus terrae]
MTMDEIIIMLIAFLGIFLVFFVKMQNYYKSKLTKEVKEVNEDVEDGMILYADGKPYKKYFKARDMWLKVEQHIPYTLTVYDKNLNERNIYHFKSRPTNIGRDYPHMSEYTRSTNMACFVDDENIVQINLDNISIYSLKPTNKEN